MRPRGSSPSRPSIARLSDARMYALVLSGDPHFDGRFFFGVTTTGIYCLPSCKARKPNRQNVRFFPTCTAARTAGLRSCKKCHPDDFARGADPVLENIETLVTEIRTQPANFAGVRSVVRRSGFGSTRTFELFRRHYQTTPASLLLRARIAHARQRLLTTDTALISIAADAGFKSLSVFHQQFRRIQGLTPSACRALRNADSFTIPLPPGYPLNYLRRALGRDPQSVSERLDDQRYTCAIRLHDTTPALLTLLLAPGSVTANLSVTGSPIPLSPPAPDSSSPHTLTPSNPAAPPGAQAHAIVTGLLGLDQDAAAFARLATRLGHARLLAHREGLRVSQTHSLFDGFIWAILGQQVNLSFASTMRRRLFEHHGTPVGNGLFATPTPAALAALAPADLLPLQFSRQKADYLISTARLITSGALDLATLPSLSATRVERSLLAIRGLGPWSVNYLMMRSLGFPDCVPLGDTGVTSGLQTFFQLGQRPDADDTRRLLAPFSPHRSLATAHLWQLHQPPPP